MAYAPSFSSRAPRLRWSRQADQLLVAGGLLAALVALRMLTLPPDVAAAAEVPPAAVVRADVVGPARVVDGDGLWVEGVEIRLHGVDAFELRQTCGDLACGVEARRALHHLVADKTVACTIVDRDRYGRSVSTCSVDGQDLGRALVRSGNAVAYARYSTAYVADEQAARAAHAGAWASDEVMAPSDWRAAR